MRKIMHCLLLLLAACSQQEKKINSSAGTKQHLLSLERKWIEAEFALDTAYISTLLDSTFINVNANYILNKQQEINGIYANMSALHKDSIFLDSLKLEDAVVNVYGDAAVISFISHTYKKDKGRPTEKRMRFYDVWIKSDGEWKAVASQGTIVAQ
jgi:hypothetical protein